MRKNTRLSLHAQVQFHTHHDSVHRAICLASWPWNVSGYHLIVSYLLCPIVSRSQTLAPRDYHPRGEGLVASDRFLRLYQKIIRASLSEPHTSGTALRKCVCNVLVCLRPYTVNFKCEFKYFPKKECPRALTVVGEGQCRVITYRS